jgi:hypothetical protein
MFQLQTQQTLKRQDIIHRVHMIKGMGASHKKGGKMCKITMSQKYLKMLLNVKTKVMATSIHE